MLMIACLLFCFFDLFASAENLTFVSTIETVKEDFSFYKNESDGAPNWYTNSICWEIKDEQYFANSPFRTFSINEKLPMGKQVKVEAILTINRKNTEQWKTAGVCIYIDRNNYWHLALVESPDNDKQNHFFELCEMYEGKWLSQTRLKTLVSQNMDYDWEYEHPYRLVLELSEGKISGTISELDETLIAKEVYQIDEQSVNYGKAGLDNGGFFAFFDNFKALVKEIVTMPEKKKSYPEYTENNFTEIKGERTGFFHIESHNGLWWVIDVNGNGFYIIGTDHANYNVHWCEKLGYAPYHKNMVEKYDNEEAWGKNTAERLRKWGFNSLGTNSSSTVRYKGLAYADTVGFGASFSSIDDIVPKAHWTGFPNVFSPKFEEYCDKLARERCAPNKNDPWLIGYFLDNELEWFGKSHTKWGLWEEAFKKPAEHSAKKSLMNFLIIRYESIEDFNDVWEKNFDDFEELSQSQTPPDLPKDELLSEIASNDRYHFVRWVAERYFSITTEAIKKHDPNHMILGTRFAGNSPDIWDIAGRYCDIVSVNTYRRVNLETGEIIGFEDELDAWYSKAKKPMMITEWSFPALDSGLPCTHGAGQRFDTQEQRAKAFLIFQEFLFRKPYMVGSNFFMWVDEPELGISSTFPENTNYGLVNVNDTPYELLTKAATKLNPQVYEHHLKRIPKTEYKQTSEIPDVSIPLSGVIACKIENNKFSIDNGKMLLKKNQDDSDMFDQIIVGDIDYGRFTPLIWQKIGDGNRWVRPNKMDKFELLSHSGNECILQITASFAKTEWEDAKDFQVKYRFTIYPRVSWFKAQLISITNTDSTPYHIEGYFQYVLSNAEDLSRIDAFPTVPNYYLRIGAWHDLDKETYYGVISIDDGYEIRFWKDKDGQHADALHRIKETLEPGGIYDLPQPPIWLFTGKGEAPWLDIIGQIKRLRIID